MPRPCDIIRKKRDGHRLTKDDITSFFSGVINGDVPDYQVTAFLMAVLLKGMTAEETFYLTEVMIGSGTVFDLSDVTGPKVDKHSTGGVGDKVSLILAPLVASAGVIVPMISGRGLGHTGGTLDKMESIPGFRTEIKDKEFREILQKNGCSIIAASGDFAPLDRKLYALRDVTATVESIPLITGSIMSKKLSEGLQGLVLDVKVGSGAFIKEIDDARELAQSMVAAGNSFGVKTVAVITDMNEPLGMAIGNSLEVRESIDALKGNGPDDLMEVTLCIGAFMLQIAGIEEDLEAGRTRLLNLIQDGSALLKFKDMIREQGGNTDILYRPTLLPHSCLSLEVASTEEGYIHSMDTEAVGTASMLLGAGRERVDSMIDHSAGILLKKKIGNYVMKDETLCEFCTNDEGAVEHAREVFLDAVKFGDEPPEEREMIKEVIQ